MKLHPQIAVVVVIAIGLVIPACDEKPSASSASSSASSLSAPTTAAAATSDGKTQRIDPSQIQPGPLQRDHLSDEQMARVRRLQQAFAEVDGRPLEKWVDDFKRDVDLDRVRE